MLKLLNAATATNSPPSAVTHGFALKKGDNPGKATEGFYPSSNSEFVLLVASTAGSGTMACTLRVWGYSPVSAVWHPLGTNSTMASRGLLNDANALGEDGSDIIRHAEVVESLRHFSRVYLEVVAISGSATAISAWLTCNGD